ncbi:hypothetical protein W97_06728 [Coniosporium apollinis CBS 100218]|uniref:Uncharacterized protein n=1 Tax=Coniosporium apollinis (strain CBS 100218) TaxID=1168221 RepID=R7Z099_CONA1|nr:uncharacterized protein W97_06728 [Coniosporium apollinis CBS 100218]EON67474.1 hypothetical protein W97_06728 [Coniosporium apollinis CBS 100218]
MENNIAIIRRYIAILQERKAHDPERGLKRATESVERLGMEFRMLAFRTSRLDTLYNDAKHENKAKDERVSQG